MPKIRVVKVVFNTKIKAYEVPAFRGAVIDMIGREHVAFHNHIGENAYHYHYPYIQYKQQGGYAALLCIEDGVEDMQAFFQKKRPQIRIGDREVSLDVRSVQLNQFQVQIWDKLFEYRLYNWLPLNEKNYGMYLSLDRVDDRLMLLKRILIGNILSMAKGIGWTVDKAYLLNLMNSNLALKLMSDNSFAPGSANLSMGDIANFPIPLPPLSEQKRIVAEIEKQFTKTKQLKEHIIANQQATEQLLKALLHQAFEEREVETV